MICCPLLVPPRLIRRQCGDRAVRQCRCRSVEGRHVRSRRLRGRAYLVKDLDAPYTARDEHVVRLQQACRAAGVRSHHADVDLRLDHAQDLYAGLQHAERHQNCARPVHKPWGMFAYTPLGDLSAFHRQWRAGQRPAVWRQPLSRQANDGLLLPLATQVERAHPGDRSHPPANRASIRSQTSVRRGALTICVWIGYFQPKATYRPSLMGDTRASRCEGRNSERRLIRNAVKRKGGEMGVSRRGAMDIRTAASLLVVATVCYSAWLTSIVFCAANGPRPLLVASAAFFPVGIVYGLGIWFGGW
jgi:hypothetical protein